MKRVLLIISAISLLFFGACRNPFIGGSPEPSLSEGTGSLSISIVQSRSIVPTVDMRITYYEITGSGPGGAGFGPITSYGASFAKSDLNLGEWTVTVEAFNGSDALIGSGEATGTIASGSSTSFAITVGPLTGDGGIDITISWPASTLTSPEVTATLTPAGGSALNAYFPVSGDSAKYTSSTAPSGYSLLVATVKEDSFSHTFMESVMVYPGTTTTGTLEITAAMIVDDIVPVPVASPAADLGPYDGDRTITLTCSQTSATIYYSLNGSVPNEDHGTEYSEPFTITSSATLKTAAVASSGLTSEIYTGEYLINNTMARPKVSISAGLYYDPIEVTLSCDTAENLIYYTTDGSTPVKYISPVYTVGDIITISSDTTVKALAVDQNVSSSDSDIMTAAYRITDYVGRPSMDLASGTYEEAQSLIIIPAMAGSRVMYTIDGSNPSEVNGTEYEDPITIDRNVTVKAVGIYTDWGNSPIVSRVFNFNTAELTASIPAGTYEAIQSVSLSCLTDDAEIYYTLDGTEPDEDSTRYTGAVQITGSQTLKAVAKRTGWTSSPVLSLSYTFKVPAPTFSVDPGTWLEGTLPLTFSSETEGVTIYYTSGATTPVDPTTASSVGTGRVTTVDTIYKLLAVKTGWDNSDIVTGSFIVGTGQPLPADTGMVFSTTPVLSWNGILNDYQIQIATSNLFEEEDIVEEASSVSGAEYQCTTTLSYPSVTYYWRVAPSGSSSWSGGPWSFTVNPTNFNVTWEGLRPEHSGTTPDTSPLFDWEPVVGAASYNVRYASTEVALSSATAMPVIPGDTEYEYPATLPLGTSYWWQVQAVNEDSVASEWSTAQNFTVEWPVTYTGLLPEDSATTTDFTPLLEWDEVEGAVSYKIRTAADSTTVLSATPTDLPDSEGFYQIDTNMSLNDTLWWQIVAVNADDIEALAWSAPQSFTVNWIPEWAGIIPCSGGEALDNMPLIQWDDVDAATSFELRFAASSGDLSSVVTPQYQDMTSEYLYPYTLTGGEIVWWQVRAVNSDDAYSQWSTEFSFTYNASAVISGQSPADTVEITDSTPLLDWDSIGGAVSYRVKTAATELGLADAVPVSVTVSEYSYPYNLAGGSTLWWQVAPVDEGDTLGDAYSTAIYFTIAGGVIPIDSLELEYLFDGNTNDTSGNSRNGTIYSSVTPTADRNDEVNKAYYFSGSNDYIYSTSFSIDWSSGFTVSVWARKDGDGDSGANSTIVTQSDNTNHAFRLYVDDSTDTPAAWAQNSAVTDTYVSADEIVSGWNHYVYIVSNDSLALYLNGNPIGFEAFTGPMRTVAAPVRIGCWVTGNYTWQGAIDDLRIYSRVLTEQEIYALADE